MKKATVKSLVLMILILGSIYQIITLWFDNVSDRNFFYSLINNVKNYTSKSITTADDVYMLYPRYIGIYLRAADKDFTVASPSGSAYDFNGIYTKSMQVITQVLKKGELEDKFKDSQVLWDAPSLFFALALPFPADIFASDLGIDESVLEDIESIDEIGIIPATEIDTDVKVYIIDADTIYLYSLSKAAIQEDNTKINKYIKQMETIDSPAYISTYKDELDIFGNNVLLPLTSRDIQYDSEISFSVPFVQSSNIDGASLEGYIDGFFVNPDLISKIDNSNELMYGDGTIIVKYNTSGLLVYKSTTGDDDRTYDAAQTYNVVGEFLKKDSLLSKQDYFLSDYETKNGETTYYFNYSYNDYPVYINDSVIETFNMETPMEITVSDGKVIRYKRILAEVIENQAAKSSLEEPRGRFVNALDEFVKSHLVSEGEIEDMYLGYYVQNAGSGKMVWIIKHNGKNYVLDL